MRLLELKSNGNVSLTKDLINNIPPYAILSHTWGNDDDEVTFKDLTEDSGKTKRGYDKILFCAAQALIDGLQYIWIDTCCIDKSSSAELQEAINSMFRWYRDAAKCYVYLRDVSTSTFEADDKSNQLLWESAFRKSRWFTRGWTLQELIAPASVEFFSKEGARLGTKKSLEPHIQDITGIPLKALRGSPLSDFRVSERMAWIENRETSRKEDKAYSLLGIFDIHMPLIYGEGEENAFRRLRGEINKASKSEQTYDQSEDRCLADLRSTDPRHDKSRIEDTKGGLLRDSYRWVLDNAEFQRWRDDKDSRLLWIKGDPGKGKTMLLCGIINELRPSTKLADHEGGSLLSFFFCQATDSRINSATAVLRGLIYILVDQQPSLISYVRTKYDHAGSRIFEDANAWVAVSEIFTNILADPNLQSTYLIIDALDECDKDLPRLLDFIIQNSASTRVKWIVSSRNIPDIEQKLRLDRSQARLSLEIKENAKQVSQAVDSYIEYCVSELPNLQDDENLQRQVKDAMRRKANGTFLWVSLVVKELRKAERWEAEEIVDEMPSDLENVYDRMLQQIQQLERGNPRLCQLVLSAITTAYRPLCLDELGILSGLPKRILDKPQSVEKIIRMCGSFLTIQDKDVYIIHQSAKDFLSNKAFGSFFPFEIRQVHHNIFSRSLSALSQTLRRDIYELEHPGSPIDKVKQPEQDPLAKVRYSCIYWVDHLQDCNPSGNADDLQDGDSVDTFLRRSYLHWLEALSLLRSISAGMLSMTKLERLFQVHTSQLPKLVRDGRRFIQYNKWAIENSPLQVYASALVFSPACSIIRNLFKQEEPHWIITKPAMEDDWNACTQTLEGHSNGVQSVVFSPDGQSLASASWDGTWDGTVRLWDPATGACTKTLKGHSSMVNSVAFSPDGRSLASASSDHTIRLWDPATGACTQTLKGCSASINSVVFSPDGRLLASALGSYIWDGTVQLWNPATGACTQTLTGHANSVLSVAFSPDGRSLASASWDCTVRLWDPATGACTQTLKGHSAGVNSVAFSPDGRSLASASVDYTIRLWDPATGACTQTLKGHSAIVFSVAFSPDSQSLASASVDCAIRLWDPAAGACTQTLKGHDDAVRSVAFSPDGQSLASASSDCTIRLWDPATRAYTQALKGHSAIVFSVVFSPDSRLLASTSSDCTIMLWDPATGACTQTLKGHSAGVFSVAFSPDSRLLASASGDGTVRLWDPATGACTQTLKGHSAGVNSVTFSPDGQLLASAWEDGTVRLWDPATGACIQMLEGHTQAVTSVAFSPDGRSLVSAPADYYSFRKGRPLPSRSALRDRTIKLWDLATGACAQTFKGHSAGVHSVAFSPDGRSIASASLDRTIRLWDPATGACTQTLDIRTSLYHLSFDRTGSYLVTSIGSIALDSSPETEQTATGTGQVPHSQARQPSCSIGPDGTWITWNGTNILWLPQEYRSERLAVAGSTVAIGCRSGRVLILGFAADALL